MENEENETNMDMSRTTNEATSFKDASPEEVKTKVKESVQKGVAAVAGALKGFTDEARKHNLAEATKEAIQKAGETTRQVVGTTAKEFQQTKQHVKAQAKGGAGATGGMTSAGSLGASRYDVGAAGGTSPGFGSNSLSGSTNVGGASSPSAMPNVSDTVPKNKAGDVGVPDLRKTDLAKDDEDILE
ncbi:MAG: hypothetical protein QOE90_2897 [Thermoplasmata archaeon]|jgi:hypothetical protein|nr:hypothetical protein [Thermoplasmata archaeon]